MMTMAMTPASLGLRFSRQQHPERAKTEQEKLGNVTHTTSPLKINRLGIANRGPSPLNANTEKQSMCQVATLTIK
jgi:hypothetical protein